jgi:hypothetical protein
MDGLREELEAMRRQVVDDGAQDISVHEAVSAILARTEVPDDLRTHAAWHLNAFSRDDWAAGADNLSLLWWDEGYEVYGYGDSVFVHGLQAVAERLAADLEVRLSHVVEAIEHSPAGVRVRTTRGVFEAEAAVVTLPLGVLKAGAVRFEPALPERKRQASRAWAWAR